MDIYLPWRRCCLHILQVIAVNMHLQSGDGWPVDGSSGDDEGTTIERIDCDKCRASLLSHRVTIIVVEMEF